MKRTLKGLGLALMILALAAVLAVGVLTWQINRLGSQDLAQPADAIVILGARVNADGSPSSDLLSRTFHAIDLFNAGLAPVVICAGGVGGDRLSAGSVACRYAAEELGVPLDHALVAQEGNAWTTADEAARVAEIMRANGWHSAILVSHPLHLFRAKWLFERQGLEVYTSPTNTNLRRIFPPLRAWYSLREAGGVILTAVQDLPLVDRLLAWLSERVYG
ncbi:MAG: YdcF family protein [Anaerolineae bacterium]|nr:YdcF family protein [Anaerolineae bacterium]